MCRRMIYGMCLLLLFAACQEEFQKSREEIVVEGWIESGASPIVLLTKSFVVELEKNVDEETSIVLPWGKVTVSDGTESVILTGDYDERYFPPYIYSTSKIKGVPGRTYYLTVEYGNRILTAQTTIPEVDSLEAITVTPCDDADGMYQITAYYDDNPATKDYYQFLTRIFNSETRYYPAFLGLQDDAWLDLHNRQVVHPGIHSLTKSEDKYHPYYHADDSVQIKFAKIDETTYNIQKAYSEMVALSSNPIFSSDVSMPHQKPNPPLILVGYAVTRYNVIIGDSIK